MGLAAFRDQMLWLADNGYAVVPLGMVTRQPKSIGIMFDDGYLDTYSNAWPILDELGYSATIFVVTGLVGHSVAWPGLQQSVKLMGWEHVREMTDAGRKAPLRRG